MTPWGSFLAKSTDKRLDELLELSSEELVRLWTAQFGVAPRFRVRRDFMIRCLAYRMQEEEHGALAPATRKRLRQLASRLLTTPSALLVDVPIAKPGTRLVRQWRGEAHSVTVADKGYLYRGKRYASLSIIARQITGTRWSGPAFFGLKAPRSETSKRQSAQAQV